MVITQADLLPSQAEEVSAGACSDPRLATHNFVPENAVVDQFGSGRRWGFRWKALANRLQSSPCWCGLSDPRQGRRGSVMLPSSHLSET